METVLLIILGVVALSVIAISMFFPPEKKAHDLDHDLDNDLEKLISKIRKDLQDLKKEVKFLSLQVARGSFARDGLQKNLGIHREQLNYLTANVNKTLA